MKARLIFTYASAIVFFATAALVPAARAQTTPSGPQLVITWKALDSAAPAAYPGKVFPGINSQVVASLAVVSNGSLISLQPYTIYWYLDDNFIGGGAGKQDIVFAAPGNAEIASLRAEITNYSSEPCEYRPHPDLEPPRGHRRPYAGGFFSQSTVSAQAALISSGYPN